ncbi:hypothetical protein GCM10022255_101930 [Dactylosporangium darangshiense]|uniref:Integral membrane protein n=1 Tax=Dactylosporangium darangshiense TaxID=579108 RepID=A0ABP8DS99_9ACTN
MNGYPWGALRGLAVGIVAGVAAVVVAALILWLHPVGDGPCGSDLACLADLEGVLLAIASVPVVVAIAAPVAARLLGAPLAGLYAVPAVWVLVVACVGVGPADRQRVWPFNSFVSSLAIYLVLYALLGLYGARAGATARPGPQAGEVTGLPPGHPE